MRSPRKATLNVPVLPANVTEALAEAVAPRLPDAERVKAMRERVLDRVRHERQRFLTVRTTDGSWLPLAPGVAVKHLQDDGAMQSFLLRLDPGARLPAHDHPSCDEHCIVVEGTARLGGHEVSRGDYHVAYVGSSHGEVTSASGAILYLRTASGTIPHR